jgi:hypothetical protein
MQCEAWNQLINSYNIIKLGKMNEMLLIHIRTIWTQQIKCVQT